MNLFGSRQLHAGHESDSGFLSRTRRGGAVERGVVVGQRKDIQPHDLCHVDKVIGSHLLVAAGRQAGVDMQIALISRHNSTPNFFAGFV